MPLHEQRLYFRIDDHIYFDYKVVEPGQLCSDLAITNQLLGESSERYMEASQYFQNINQELAALTQTMGLKEPALAHYLNLINAKIDYLSRQMLMSEKVHMRKVSLSLGGMAFRTNELHKEKTALKLVIYTKPKMVPIIVDAAVVYSKYITDNHYRTAVAFNSLTGEQEQLLAQHILEIQTKKRSD